MSGQKGLIGKGVVRKPVLPFNTVEQLGEKALRSFMNHSTIKESIKFASSSLFADVEKWLADELNQTKKEVVLQKLYKYMVRMSTRATPYALCSGIEYTEVVECDLKQNESPSFQFQVNLDTCALDQLKQALLSNKAVIESIHYQSNNTIYFLGDEVRYFEPKRNAGALLFDLSKIGGNETLKELFETCSNKPLHFQELVQYFIPTGHSVEEITPFVHELIEAGLLIPEIEVYLTNPDILSLYIGILEKGELTELVYEETGVSYYSTLVELKKAIQDHNQDVSSKLNAVATLFRQIGIEPKKGDLLHIDAIKKGKETAKLKLTSEQKKQLEESHELLAKLMPKKEDLFEQFKKDFNRRYEGKTLPLLQVLDPEIGIGYTQKSEQGVTSHLLKDVSVNYKFGTSAEVKLSQVEQFLHEKLVDALQNGSTQIELKNEHVARLPNIPVSVTQSAMFSLLKNDQIYLSEFTGASALNMINRFAYLDEGLHQLCKEIHEYEQQQFGDALIAEMIHLPELKSGNIVRHKSVRELELPCVTLSEDKSEVKQIHLSDIYIRLNERQAIELHSRSLNKQIIPRLSNALNYYRDGIDVFRFLADLQYQHESGVLQFDWLNLSKMFHFFPRVTYQDVILSPACWKIKKDQFKSMDQDNLDLFKQEVLAFKKIKNIPNTAYVASSIIDDYKLFIDFDNPIALGVLKEELKRNETLYFSEVFDHKTAENELTYVNEVVLPFFNERTSGNQHTQADLSTEQDEFLPGSNWLYVKLYAGYETVNQLLTTELYPFMHQLLDENIIQKWFFIRYADEDYHLRLRFDLIEPAHMAMVLQRLSDLIRDQVRTNVIHKVTVSTYEREIERYGKETIPHCEELFFHDSMLICDFLSQPNAKENDWLFGAMAVDQYLTDFGFGLEQKMNILGFISNQFFMEFGVIKKEKVELDKKYRKLSSALKEGLQFNHESEENELLAFYKDMLLNKSGQTSSIVNEIKLDEAIQQTEGRLADVVLSMIHMLLNRLFRTNHRKQELILYYMMYKQYKSAHALQRKAVHA